MALLGPRGGAGGVGRQWRRVERRLNSGGAHGAVASKGVVCAREMVVLPYVGIARRAGNGRTDGFLCAADHGTGRDDFDAPRCGCGLGRCGASRRSDLGMARPREAGRGLGRRGRARPDARARGLSCRRNVAGPVGSSANVLT
jgi:hypothetical protein